MLPRGLCLFLRLNHYAGYTQGTVWTPHGSLTALAQGDADHHCRTCLQLLHVRTGEIMQRTWTCRVTHRGIAAARRFAREVR